MKKMILTGGADEEAKELLCKIKKSNESLSGNTIYYVSSISGCDENDGLSPQTPVKTLERTKLFPLSSGIVVLFERGSIFRLKDTYLIRGGVKYGTYGQGAKPQFLGSQRNYADKNIWKSGQDNIWETKITILEAGNIIFNDGDSYGFRKNSLLELSDDGDYYHNTETGVIYLKQNEGNPGEVFYSIEISTLNTIFKAQNVNDVTICDLEFRYASCFAIDLGNNMEVMIKGCEVLFVGGALYKPNPGIRYGNGIQFWLCAVDVRVENCYFSEIFDAAVTFQGCGNKNPYFKNICFSNNLIEYCSMNIEYWAGNKSTDVPVVHNILIENNIVRFGGLGFGGLQRSDKGDQALFLAWNNIYSDMSDFVLRNNIFDVSDCYVFFAIKPDFQKGFESYKNIFYQRKIGNNGFYRQVVQNSNLTAENQEQFEVAVLDFEKEPQKIVWLDN